MQRNRGNRRDAWPSLLPAIGTCSSADTSVRKSGSHLAKGSLCLLCSRLAFDQILLTVFTPTCRETAAALTCQRISRSSNPCGVLGCRQSCGLNSQASRWWDSPFRVLLETCVLEPTCSHRPGNTGTIE